MSWPAIRTEPVLFAPQQHLLAGIGTFLLMPLIGLAISVLGIVALYTTASDRAVSIFAAPGLILTFGALFSWIGMIFLVPVAARACARGWAGWASSLVAGAAIGFCVGLAIGLVRAGLHPPNPEVLRADNLTHPLPAVYGTVSGALHALLHMSLLRRRARPGGAASQPN
ncbi:hypothetical protein [Mesobacterium pallidum]|uniref:hypothetical protein n=1 Tax=Mesobacterium pallidum TaxID=2872037 RepID=UPI001EE1BDE9|nr:hypothetical protein [Mesobacterium pallidum]